MMPIVQNRSEATAFTTRAKPPGGNRFAPVLNAPLAWLDFIRFTLKVETQGQALTIIYTGTIEKDGTMKGTVAVGDAGSGTWTGKRQ